MDFKDPKYAVEQILERVLKEEGATDKDLDTWRWQIVAYADDVVSMRMGVIEACSEIQDLYLVMG